MTTTLITGATRGVGLELAGRLAEAGHTVYLGARDLERGRAVAEPMGARAIAIDVTDDASVGVAVERLRQEVGSLDVLVNNAGISGTQRTWWAQPGCSWRAHPCWSRVHAQSW